MSTAALDPAGRHRPLIWCLAGLLFLVLLFPVTIRARAGVFDPEVLPLESPNDEQVYLTYIKRGVTGPWATGDPVLAEHDPGPQARMAWIEMAVGRLGSWGGLEWWQIYWANLVIFPLLMAWALWRLGLTLGLRPPAAALAAFVIVAGLIGSGCLRTMHPRVTGTLFYFQLWAFAAHLRAPTRRTTLGLAATTALQFYSYAFYWAFAMVATAVATVLVIWRSGWRPALTVAGGVALALPLAIPFVMSMGEIAGTGELADLLYRMAYQNSDPVFSKSNWLLLALLAWRRPPGRVGIFFWTVALAGLVCTNQQLITGSHPTSSRYIWYIVKPVLALWLIFDLDALLRSHVRRRRLVAVLAVVGAVGSYLQDLRDFTAPHELYATAVEKHQTSHQELFTWLSKHAEPGSVVACPLELAGTLPLYTDLKVYASLNSIMQLVGQDEITGRLHELHQLTGQTAAEYRDLLDEKTGTIAAQHYCTRFSRLTGDYEDVPPELVEQLARHYEKTISRSGGVWSPRWAVDYVAWKVLDGRSLPLGPEFEEVAVVGDWTVWRRVSARNR